MGSVGKSKKHVLIIDENGTVPFDRRVWLEAKALSNCNYEVSVICPKGINANDSHEYKSGVHIYRHPVPRESESIIGYLKEYLTALWWEWFLSFRLFIRNPFNVIHACNPPDNIFLIGFFYKFFGVKFIFDHHDLAPEQYLVKFARKDFFYHALLMLEKLTFRLADISIATNKSYREIAIQRGGMNPENVFVVRNGPELDKFKKVPAKKELKYGKKHLIGYVGYMAKQEGIDFLLEVVKFIVRNVGRTDIHFTCVGNGLGLNYCKKLADDMDLTHFINFTGRIPLKELLEILSTSDVCVNPDTPCELNDKSTMVKIMEYMAAGKPIVQCDFREGKYSASESSFYAKWGSVEDFSGKILTLINKEDLRKKMGDFGYRRVRDKLEWKYSISHLLKAYETVFQ